MKKQLNPAPKQVLGNKISNDELAVSSAVKAHIEKLSFWCVLDAVSTIKKKEMMMKSRVPSV